MPPHLVEVVGFAAGALTTLCWLPQAIKIIRARSARDLSLITQFAFTAGMLLWFVYGLLLGKPALIVPNGITFSLAAMILVLKLRFG